MRKKNFLATTSLALAAALVAPTSVHACGLLVPDEPEIAVEMIEAPSEDEIARTRSGGVWIPDEPEITDLDEAGEGIGDAVDEYPETSSTPELKAGALKPQFSVELIRRDESAPDTSSGSLTPAEAVKEARQSEAALEKKAKAKAKAAKKSAAKKTQKAQKAKRAKTRKAKKTRK